VVTFIEAVGDVCEVRKFMGDYFTKFVTRDGVEHIFWMSRETSRALVGMLPLDSGWVINL
jgi:hypothetical protein